MARAVGASLGALAVRQLRAHFLGIDLNYLIRTDIQQLQPLIPVLVLGTSLAVALAGLELLALLERFTCLPVDDTTTPGGIMANGAGLVVSSFWPVAGSSGRAPTGVRVSEIERGGQQRRS